MTFTEEILESLSTIHNHLNVLHDKLNELFKCTNCDGKGYFERRYIENPFEIHKQQCAKCNGTRTTTSPYFTFE